MLTTIEARLPARWWIVAAWLAAAPAAARAQNELDSAITLARSGQYDRAEVAAVKLAKRPELKPSADIIRAEVLLARSDAESQLDPALKLLDDSIELLRACLRANPQRNITALAKRGINWRFHRKALRAADALRALKPSETAQRRDALLETTVSLYEAAALRLREHLRGLKGEAGAPDDQDVPETELDLARTLFEHGRLPWLSQDAKKSLIVEAISVLEDVEFDYADEAVAFEALWLEGLCHWELGSPSVARDRFEGAATILRRVRAAKKEPSEYHLGIAQSAYVDLCRSYLEDHNPEEVVRFVERVFRDEPALANGAPGHALRLQKADALFQKGDIEGAYSLASQVMSADPTGKLGAAARDKVRAWAAEGATQGGKTSPDRLLVLATALQESENWAQALQTLQSTIELASASEENKKILPEAYFKAGQSLFHLGKPKEAAAYFERVVKEHESDPLAPQACYEAVRALSSEYSASGHAEDDSAKEALLSLLLAKWPTHPVARNVVCIQAEKLEREKRYKEAADLYAKVPSDAEAAETALLAGARCRYVNGCALWDVREKQPSSANEAKSEMTQGLAVLDKLFERFNDPASAVQGAGAMRQRSSVIFVAVSQRAQLQLHEAVGQYEPGLEALTRYAETLGKDDPRLARVLALEARGYLAAGKSDEAEKTVDALLEKFPESPSALPAFRLAASRLDQGAADLKSKNGDPAKIEAMLAKAHKLYLQWAKGSEKTGQKLAPLELLGVAEALSANAKMLNHLPETASFVLAPGARLEAPQYLADALQLLRLALDGKLGPIDAKERLRGTIEAARLEGFLATDASAWEKTRERYQAIIQEAKLLTPDKKIDPKALASPQQSNLLTAYLELGVAYQEESKQGRSALFDLAVEVFQNVQSVTQAESEPWWLSKLLILRAYVERATPADLRVARIVLENTEKNYPEFDGGAFGIKARIIELRERISGSKSIAP
jgi:hypothetical protein